MKRSTTLAAYAAAFAASLLTCAAQASALDPLDVSDNVLIKKFEKAFGEATHYDHIDRMYADDAILLDVFTPGFYRGAGKIRTALAWQFEGMLEAKDKFVEFNLMRHASLACAASVQHISIINEKTPGKTFNVTFMFNNVWRKINGRWYIIANAAAFPVDPKTLNTTTGQSLTEEKPDVVHEADWFSGPAVPVAQAKKELRKWANALHAAQTADEATKFYDQDVTFYSGLNPNVYHGRDKMLERFRDDMKDIKSIKVRERESGIETDGVLGVVWSLQDVDLMMSNGEKQKMNVRQLDCLRRKEGNWLSVFQIRSIPIDANTWKGVPLLQYGDKPVREAGTGNVFVPGQ